MAAPKDLVVLTADKDMEQTIRGLLERHESIGIHALNFDIFVHPNRDPGCLREGHTFLREFLSRFKHAILMMDREGCGQESTSRTELESEIERRLSQSGWGERAAAVVLDPELEIWVWSDSPEVDRALGWSDNDRDLRGALRKTGLLAEGGSKPNDPKAALEYALRSAKLPRSSSIYNQIARNVSVKRCVDPSFHKFKTTLQTWFSKL